MHEGSTDRSVNISYHLNRYFMQETSLKKFAFMVSSWLWAYA